MDTHNDPSADSFPQGRCTYLQNAFPGDPPKPLDGCKDILVDTTIQATGPALFQLPVASIRSPLGELHALVITVNEADRSKFFLECWNIDAAIRYQVCGGTYSEETKFALVPLDGKIYLFSGEAQVSDDIGSTEALGHKAIEYNPVTDRYVSAELFIRNYALLSLAAVAANATGLTVGQWVSYAATFIRHTDASAFSSSTEKTAANAIEVGASTGFLQAENEGVEQVSDRLQVFVDTGSSTTYGDATTEILVSYRGNGITRYEHAGGLAPTFNMDTETYLSVDSPELSSGNSGIFKVVSVDPSNEWVDVENPDSVGESVVLGVAGALSIRSAKVTLTFSSSPDTSSHATDGATHMRIWRTDHGISSDVVKGLSHRWLVDIPLSANSYVDTTTRGSLLGETNFLSATGYTAPPVRAGFAAFSSKAGRIFAGGDPDQRGRWWFSEFPGGDGATQVAQQVPNKFRSMWNTATYWVDADKDDGQYDTGIAVLRDDVYLFKERKVFVLFNSDIEQKPLCISHNIGCPFPNTIIRVELAGVGEIVFFLSNEGPAVIYPGGTVQVFSEFPIAELWPGGELINTANSAMIPEYERYQVHSIFHRNTIWVCYGDSEDGDATLTSNTVFGYHRSPDERYHGALKFVLEDVEI